LPPLDDDYLGNLTAREAAVEAKERDMQAREAAVKAKEQEMRGKLDAAVAAKEQEMQGKLNAAVAAKEQSLQARLAAAAKPRPPAEDATQQTYTAAAWDGLQKQVRELQDELKQKEKELEVAGTPRPFAGPPALREGSEGSVRPSSFRRKTPLPLAQCQAVSYEKIPTHPLPFV
jgi:hypothetical protein